MNWVYCHNRAVHFEWAVIQRSLLSNIAGCLLGLLSQTSRHKSSLHQVHSRLKAVQNLTKMHNTWKQTQFELEQIWQQLVFQLFHWNNFKIIYFTCKHGINVVSVVLFVQSERIQGQERSTLPVTRWVLNHTTLTSLCISLLVRTVHWPQTSKDSVDFIKILCVFIAVCLSVCLSVCVSVCPWPHLWNRWTDLHEICYADPLWPWLGPALVALRYVMYFRFYGWRHVWL